MTKEDLGMLTEMKDLAYKLLNEWHSEKDFKVGFHKPLIATVKHLHLHMIVEPLSLKGKMLFNRMTFNSIDEIIDRIKK